MTRTPSALAALALLTACTDAADPDGVDAATETEAPFVFDMDACGDTCEGGVVYLLDELALAVAGDDGLVGFNLDGQVGDCGAPDGVSPDGEEGIDNRIGAMLDTLPLAVRDLAPALLASLVPTGEIHVLFEVVGVTGVEDEGRAAVVVRRGAGDVLTGGEGRPIPQQTNGLWPDEPLLGVAEEAEVSGAMLQTSPFDVDLRFSVLGSPVSIPMRRALLRMVSDGEGGADILLGGVIPLDDATGLLDLLGGCDQALSDLLEPLLPLLVDARTSPDGECDGISAAITGHVVPAYIFSE